MEPSLPESSAQPGPPRALGGSALREVLLVYGAVFVGTMILGAIHTQTMLDDAAQVGIALMFLGIPLSLARREPGGAQRYGIDLSGLLEPAPTAAGQPAPSLLRAAWTALPDGLREFGFALGVAAVVFPPFVVGFASWHQPHHDYALHLPPDFASFALAQFVLVGLPEEAFFRGFVQTRLHDFAGGRKGFWWVKRKVLGAELALLPWILQAVLFAFIHLASEPRLDELATFFPGLLFAWFRARRGGIGAALSFHAFSNILAELLVRGWLG